MLRKPQVRPQKSLEGVWGNPFYRKVPQKDRSKEVGVKHRILGNLFVKGFPNPS